MRGIEVKLNECFLYFLIFYSTLIHFLSDGFLDSITDAEIPRLISQEVSTFSEISLVLNSQDDCPSSYESIISQDWLGFNKGYYCIDDGIIYNLNQIHLEQKNCFELQQVQHHIIDTFGIFNHHTNQIIAFKICVQKNYEQYYNQDTPSTYQVIDNDSNIQITSSTASIQQDDINSQHIINLQSNTQPLSQQTQVKKDSNYNNKDNINDDNMNMKINNKNNKNSRRYCQIGKKECIYKNKVICTYKKRCPISNIKIVRKEQNKRQDSDERVSINQEYELRIERENQSMLPIIDIRLSHTEGVCVDNNKQQISKQYYALDKRTVCDQLDTHYKQLSSPTLSAKQLYAVNQIDIYNHSNYISHQEQITLFAKYSSSSSYLENCISDEQQDETKELFSSTVQFADLLNNITLLQVILSLLLILAKKPPTMILPYINSIKIQILLLLISAFIYLNSLWILIVINSKLSDIKANLIQFISNDCLSNEITSQIRKYLTRNIQDIKFGFLMALFFLPIVVYIIIKLVTKFCWMRQNSQNLIPSLPTSIEMQQMRRRLLQRQQQSQQPQQQQS